MCSIPGSGRYPTGRNGNPLQYSCLESPMDRGAWWSTVHKVTKSWTWWSDLAPIPQSFFLFQILTSLFFFFLQLSNTFLRLWRYWPVCECNSFKLNLVIWVEVPLMEWPKFIWHNIFYESTTYDHTSDQNWLFYFSDVDAVQRNTNLRKSHDLENWAFTVFILHLPQSKTKL